MSGCGKVRVKLQRVSTSDVWPAVGNKWSLSQCASQWMKKTSTSVLPLSTPTHKMSNMLCGTHPKKYVLLCLLHQNYFSKCRTVIVLLCNYRVLTQLLASASYDNNICIYKEEDDDWECRATLKGHTSTVWSLCFDAAGQRIASCSDDRTVKIWKEYPGESAQGELIVLESVNINLVIKGLLNISCISTSFRLLKFCRTCLLRKCLQ